LNPDIQSVRDVLQRFQDGYTQRDLDRVDAFMELFVPDDTLEVIGTGAVGFGGFEWCIGRQETRELVHNDWQGWGDLRLDVDGAHIHTLGDTAWLATTATVSMTIERESGYQNYLETIRSQLEEDTPDPESLVIDIFRGAANTIYELRKGSRFIWPIRFTAVLVRKEGRWLFHQMQFSFPTTRFPDERVGE
jgi:hypothetical protein